MREAISILLLFLNCVNVSKANIYKKLHHHSPAPNSLLKCTEMLINHVDNLPLQEEPQLSLFFSLGWSSGPVLPEPRRQASPSPLGTAAQAQSSMSDS